MTLPAAVVGDPRLARPGHRGNGQVVVIFAGAMLAMTLMMAIVIDLSWLWSSSLRIQRAADAAALAGAATLPNDPNRGFALARAEALKNGFDDTAAGVDVTPDYQPSVNLYRMNVTIKAPVGMFFMRVIGLNAFNVTRTAHAELNLPLKMGSPQQWYGVGTFEKLQAIAGPEVDGPPEPTDWSPPATTPAGNWTRPDLADATDDNQYAESDATNGSSQEWGNFDLTAPGAIPPRATIVGIEVRYRALITGSDSPTTTCRLLTQLSWNDGGNWTTPALGQILTLAEDVYTIGNATSVAGWPRAGPWAFSSFTNSNFRVRLTWNKPTCGTNRTGSVDTLEVRVTYSPKVPGPPVYVPDPDTTIPTPPGETVAPTSQGFWGAIFTRGGVRRNGDRYAPDFYVGGSGTRNPDHVDEGYDYSIEIGGSNGRVHLFDPVFCATGQNPAGSGNYGAGDHWTELPAGGIPNGPVTTEFTLLDTRGTLINKLDDTVVGAPLVYTSRASDQSGEFDDPAVGGSGAGDIPTAPPVNNCLADPAIMAAHNKWVTMTTGLPNGTYRLNVKSSQPGNAGTAAENLWSIYVGDDGPLDSARVFGDAKMVAYSNLNGVGPKQEFYLAQIPQENAGKTVEIRLFDPGDVAGDATLRIRSPDGNTYNYATFDYQADGSCNSGISDTCAGTGRTSIRTAVGGSSSFDNSVVTISVSLPLAYGSGGLRPSPEREDGWWKIEYQVGAANDTTTWEVSIVENPVHLVVE